MLDLDSPRWRALRDAYTTGERIPPLLRAVADGDKGAGWGLYNAFALVDQASVPEAAIAAVPYLCASATRAPAWRLEVKGRTNKLGYWCAGGIDQGPGQSRALVEQAGSEAVPG